MPQDFKPVHPGIILEEIVKELGLSQSQIAADIGVPDTTIIEIIEGSRPVNAEVALRLGKYFGQTPQFWLNLQANYDISVAKEKIGSHLNAIRQLTVAA